MTVDELMYKLRSRQLDEFRTSSGMGLRYKAGRYQFLCVSCGFEKWDDIAESFAFRMANKMLSEGI